MKYKEKSLFNTLDWDLGPQKCPVCGNYDCWDHFMKYEPRTF